MRILFLLAHIVICCKRGTERGTKCVAKSDPREKNSKFALDFLVEAVYIFNAPLHRGAAG